MIQQLAYPSLSVNAFLSRLRQGTSDRLSYGPVLFSISLWLIKQPVGALILSL